MKLSLVVLTPGKQEGKALEIKLSQFVIGRDPQCHLRPASTMISKRHCAVIQRDGKAFLRDFDSTNGTFVNDEPIKGEVELKDGDTLKVGPVHFKIQIEASTPAINRATPVPPTKGAKAKPREVAKDDTAASMPAKKPEPKPEEPKPAAAARKPDSPKPAARAASDEKSGEDDDIAAMLLSLHDDDDGPSPADLGDIPDGTTELEMRVPEELLAGEGSEEGKDKDKDKAKSSSSGNTSNAAKAILEKYMRRPRS